MRDLQDLDRAWAELDARADAHPLSDGLLTAPRHHRGRRIAVMAGAGATVAAVAVGVVLVGNRNNTPTAAPATGTHQHAQSSAHVKPVAPGPKDDGPGWTTLPTGHYLVTVNAISDASIRSVIGVGTPETDTGYGGDYQEVQVMGLGSGVVIKVNAPGAWAPSGGQHLIFDGRDAYYGTFLRHPEIPGHPVPPRVSLAWQYEPGAWATIGTLSETPIALADAEQYASQIKIELGGPIPSPPPQDK